MGMRTYAPYMAQHLDWYIDPDKPAEDQLFYAQTARADIAHWGRNVVKLPVEQPVELPVEQPIPPASAPLPQSTAPP